MVAQVVLCAYKVFVLSYFHPMDKAKEFAVAALKSIESRGLSPTPENYELWFVFHSKANAELCGVLDLLISSEAGVSEAQCYELFQKFLNGNKTDEAVRNAGSQIQKMITDVNDVVESTREFAAEYNHSLEAVDTKLREERTREEIETILSDILADTRTMMDQNTHLEDLLAEAASEMEKLHRDLELARKEAMTDSLTALANRKSFDMELHRAVSDVQTGESSTFTLMMLDIDHFKAFNDNFGHQVGDQVLKLVAKTLKEGVKGRDTVARYGGEEFSVILPDTGLDGGLRVAELLRQEVAKKEVINRSTGERIARITLSVGVAEFSSTEETEALVGRADNALYCAKNNGRNQVAAALPVKVKQKTH